MTAVPSAPVGRGKQFLGVLLLWPAVWSAVVTGVSTLLALNLLQNHERSATGLLALLLAAPGLLAGYVVSFLATGCRVHADPEMTILVPISALINLWFYYRIFQGLFWVRKRLFFWWHRRGR